MGPMHLFPDWFPTDELLIALSALIVLVLLMNRGRWWVLNVLAQDEPVLSAIGIFLFVGAGWLSTTLGFAGVAVWQSVGLVLAVSGVVIWWSDKLDISRLI